MSIKKHFTIWYVKRGYTFGVTDSVFECPFWVKTLLIFFSPNVYTQIVFGEIIYKSLVEGMKGVKMIDMIETIYDQPSERRTIDDCIPKLTEEEKNFEQLTIKQCGFVFYFSYGTLLWYYPG